MKVSMNAESLRMIVLKQIVANASICLQLERKIWFIDWILVFTPRNLKLKSLRKRGDRLQLFETALSKNESEMVEVDFHDVNFIHKGL